MMAKKKKRSVKRKAVNTYPIAYWSHSSLMAYLRNPLAWYTRYVMKIYDAPRTPASVIGSAGHLALEHYYKGESKEVSIQKGLQYLRDIPDFEMAFGVHKSRKAQKAKRASMEKEYLQAIEHYLTRPPRHKVVGVELRHMAGVPGLPLPVKAVSDLVVESKGNKGALDIVDHKFVESFSSKKDLKPAFMLQAIFNYYTVSQFYNMPIKRFVIYECKKRKNKDGSSQMRKYTLHFDEAQETFEIFHRLLADASEQITRERIFLPNPSDMFEGEHSFELYRLGLNE